MVYYKNDEEGLKRMNESIQSWLKMGVSVYSIFPFKEGYLLSVNIG